MSTKQKMSKCALNKGNNKITEHRAIFQRKGKTHRSKNRQDQSITGKLGKSQWS